MKVMSFTNHKGGVGKSTSTLNVGLALAAMGNKVLLIDCDAQCNLTMCFDRPITHAYNIGDVLEAKASIISVVQEVSENLALVSATPSLGYLEKVIGAQQGYEYLLRESLEQIDDYYDYCLIDTPPSLSSLTYTALVASNTVFIPTQPEYFGFEGLQTILEACSRLQKRANPTLRVGGIFFTKYSKTYRRKLHHDIVEATVERFDDRNLVMKTTIRDNVSLPEAQIQRQSIYEYAPTSNGAKDYIDLTKEILSRLS